MDIWFFGTDDVINRYDPRIKVGDLYCANKRGSASKSTEMWLRRVTDRNNPLVTVPTGSEILDYENNRIVVLTPSDYYVRDIIPDNSNETYGDF